MGDTREAAPFARIAMGRGPAAGLVSVTGTVLPRLDPAMRAALSGTGSALVFAPPLAIESGIGSSLIFTIPA